MADLNGLEVKINPINKIKYENGIFSIKIDPNNFYSEKGTTKEELEKQIEFFAHTMLKKCENFNINNFINRIRKLFFCHIKYNSTNASSEGDYDYEHGLLRFNNYDTLNHELMHAAKQKAKRGRITKGGLTFNIDNNDDIDTGLDEGNTEILKERYFGKSYNKSYWFERLFYKHMENLIGQNAIEKISFDAEYIDMYLELTDYLSVEETLLFLDCIDFSTESRILERTDISKNEYLLCKKHMEIISRIFQKAYLSKLRKEKISSKEFKKYININLWRIGGVAILHSKYGNELKTIWFTDNKEYDEFKEKYKVLKEKGINR